jgi:hypothetical protein
VSTISHKDEKDLENARSGILSQCVCINMLKNDINNDQKGQRVVTTDSIAQKKKSHAMKMIPKPETPKISTIVQ